MIFQGMINGWRPPVRLTDALGKEIRDRIFIGKRLKITIEGNPEDIKALQQGIEKGWKPEIWLMREDKE